MNDNAPLSDLERQVVQLRLACLGLSGQIDALVDASRQLERTSLRAIDGLRRLAAVAGQEGMAVR